MSLIPTPTRFRQPLFSQTLLQTRLFFVTALFAAVLPYSFVSLFSPMKFVGAAAAQRRGMTIASEVGCQIMVAKLTLLTFLVVGLCNFSAKLMV